MHGPHARAGHPGEPGVGCGRAEGRALLLVLVLLAVCPLPIASLLHFPLSPCCSACLQIGKEIKQFGKAVNLTCVCVFGGSGIANQVGLGSLACTRRAREAGSHCFLALASAPVGALLTACP